MKKEGVVMSSLVQFIQAMSLDSHAATGALSGAMVFLMTPYISSKWERLAKTFLSFVIGYAVGIAAGPGHAMWASILASATGVLVLSALMQLLQREEALFETLEKLAEITKRFMK